MSSIFNWLDEKNNGENKGNIFSPAMDDKEFIGFIMEYLCPDYVSVNPISHEQINTEVLFEVLNKYSKKFKREVKKSKKDYKYKLKMCKKGCLYCKHKCDNCPWRT